MANLDDKELTFSFNFTLSVPDVAHPILSDTWYQELVEEVCKQVVTAYSKGFAGNYLFGRQVNFPAPTEDLDSHGLLLHAAHQAGSEGGLDELPEEMHALGSVGIKREDTNHG